MVEKMLLLDHIDKVKQFVDITVSKDYNIEVSSGKYIVNAKSIIGIFSLDLTKPVKMTAHCEKVAELMKQIQPFLYKEEKKL